MANKNYKLLFIGNHLHHNDEIKTANLSMSEALAARLEEKGWSISLTSDEINPVLRLMDMVWVTITKRKEYVLAVVDLFSGRAFLWAEVCTLVLRILNKPYVIAMRGGNLPEFSIQYPKRVNQMLDNAPSIISPSKYLQLEMKKFSNKIEIIPNPIELPKYKFESRKEPVARLVWLRAFHEIYNPTLAPKIIKNLSVDFPDIELTMVGPDKGDGSFEKTIEAANRLGVKDRIAFPGLVSKNEVPYWLNKDDIFINTTNVDNTPVSVIEAMACGLCVVSTNVGGIPYLLEDGVDALLVPPDDPQAMAEAVKRILSDPELAAKLSMNAREKSESFSWEKVLPMWEALFYEIIGESRG